VHVAGSIKCIASSLHTCMPSYTYMPFAVCCTSALPTVHAATAHSVLMLTSNRLRGEQQRPTAGACSVLLTFTLTAPFRHLLSPAGNPTFDTRRLYDKTNHAQHQRVPSQKAIHVTCLNSRRASTVVSCSGTQRPMPSVCKSNVSACFQAPRRKAGAGLQTVEGSRPVGLRSD